MTDRQKGHEWVSNRAFETLTGLWRVCLRCGLGLERGERLVESCPGERPAPLRSKEPTDAR